MSALQSNRVLSPWRRGVPRPANVIVQEYRQLLNGRENAVLDCILSDRTKSDMVEEFDITGDAINKLFASIRKKLPCPDGTHLRTWLRWKLEKTNSAICH